MTRVSVLKPKIANGLLLIFWALTVLLLIVSSPMWTVSGALFAQEQVSAAKYFDEATVKAVLETIRSRRTVREYQDTPIPADHLLAILDAARYAPTAGNVQPWKFVVVQDRDRLDELSRVLQASWTEKVSAKPDLNEETRQSHIEGGQEAIRNVMTAPVYVFIFVDTTVFPQYALYDGCLAVENLMLAARAMGYGTGFFTSYFPETVVKSFLDTPTALQLICATPIGIPVEWPPVPEKKTLDEFIVYDRFTER